MTSILLVQPILDECELPVLTTLSKDQYIIECMKNIELPSTYDLIALHPTTFYQLFAVSNFFSVSPGQLANIAVMYHLWEGANNIWLWSCGSGSNGLGQSLANITGTIVKAPITTLFCVSDGFYFVADISHEEADAIVQYGLERSIFDEDNQADKWCYLIPESNLDENESKDLVSSVETLLSYYEYNLSFDKYCDELSSKYDDDFSSETILNDEYKRKELWANLTWLDQQIYERFDYGKRK